MNFLEKRDWQEDALADVQRQIAKLSRDLKSLGHHSEQSLRRGAHDVGELLADEASEMARHIGRGARQVGRTAGKARRAFVRDPMPSVIAVIGIGCLISMMMSRRS